MSILLTNATLCADPPDLQFVLLQTFFFFRLSAVCALIGMSGKFIDVYLLQLLPLHLSVSVCIAAFVTMQRTKLDPTIMNRPDGFLLPLKFALGKSVHHIRRVVGVFTLQHKHCALFKNSTREISPSCACFSNKQTNR